MTTEHTPGPWTVVRDCTVRGPMGNTVAECCGYSTKAQHPDQKAQGGREANARLIAAAPELLEALKECITDPGATCFARGGLGHAHTRIDAITQIAKAAIAKAESREVSNAMPNND